MELIRSAVVASVVASIVIAPAVAAASVDGACTAAIDEGADGIVDAYDHFDYDEAGRLRYVSRYAARASTPSSIAEHVYDSYGRLWGIAIDLDVDGAADRYIYRNYFSDGRLSSEAVDEGADGSYDRFAFYSYSNDGSVRHGAIDEDGDWRLDYYEVVVYEWTPEGLLKRETLDKRDDGILDSTVEYYYDDAGRLVDAFRDDGVDGTVDLATHYDYTGC
jgi:hypothetical protein